MWVTPAANWTTGQVDGQISSVRGLYPVVLHPHQRMAVSGIRSTDRGIVIATSSPAIEHDGPFLPLSPGLGPVSTTSQVSKTKRWRAESWLVYLQTIKIARRHDPLTLTSGHLTILSYLDPSTKLSTFSPAAGPPDCSRSLPSCTSSANRVRRGAHRQFQAKIYPPRGRISRLPTANQGPPAGPRYPLLCFVCLLPEKYVHRSSLHSIRRSIPKGLVVRGQTFRDAHCPHDNIDSNEVVWA